jgi:hypothetical protein
MFFVSPKEKLAVVALTQLLPPTSHSGRAQLKQIVYSSLTVADGSIHCPSRL